MITNSLPATPTPQQVDRAGEQYGELLLHNSTGVERRVIHAYGQHLLSGMPPTPGLTLRFFRELGDLAPRMKGYSVQVARLSLHQGLISRLQNGIAVYVARNDTDQGV